MESEPLNKTPETPEFIKKQITEKIGYPIIDEHIAEAIEKYNLQKESRSNKELDQVLLLDDSFEIQEYDYSAKKADIALRKNDTFSYFGGGISYYNENGSIRLSDHWNTREDNKTNFPVETYFAYVAKQNEENKNTWDLLEKIPLYLSQPSSLAERNRYLLQFQQKIKQELQGSVKEVKNMNVPTFETECTIYNKEYTSYLEAAVSRWRNVLETPEQYLLSFVQYIDEVEKKLQSQTDLAAIKHDTELIQQIRSTLLTSENISLANKYHSLEEEHTRERYLGDAQAISENKEGGKDTVSEYW